MYLIKGLRYQSKKIKIDNNRYYLNFNKNDKFKKIYKKRT